MKAATFLETLRQLGIEPSKSRPRVSDDNPYVESLFRTCKYRPAFPHKGFVDLHQARLWIHGFVNWYNNEHRHSGIQFVAPQIRHNQQDEAILANRKKLYELARERCPQRWSRHTRNWHAVKEVWLNPGKRDQTSEIVTGSLSNSLHEAVTSSTGLSVAALDERHAPHAIVFNANTL